MRPDTQDESSATSTQARLDGSAILSDDGGDDKHARRVAAHADQERLVRRFIDVSHQRLAGRDRESFRLRGRQPRERVVLGVLLPQDPPATELSVSAGDLPVEPGVPVDQLPASEFGLTCLVEPKDEQLTVDVNVRFAVYRQHYPTFEEQSEHAALLARKEEERSQEVADSVEGSSLGVHEEADEPSVGQVGAIDDNDGLNTAEVCAVTVGEVDSRQMKVPGPDNAAKSPAARRGKREAADPTLLVYQRYEVATTLQLTVPLPGSSIPVTVKDEGALQSATLRAFESPATSALAAHAGPAGGRYRLLASAGQRIPREAMADGDTFDAWLAAHAVPGWTAPVAEPQFTATTHRDPAGRVRLALTLSNAAVRQPRDRGFLPEVSIYDAGFDATILGGGLVNMGYRIVDTDYRIKPEVYAHGRFCCLDEDASDPAAGRLVTTAFPVFRQAVYESRPDLEPTFVDLARDPIPLLRDIAEHMQDFLDQWDAYLDGQPPLPPDALARCRADRETFDDERRRFIVGIDLIEVDLRSPNPGGLGLAFSWMNQAMRRMDAPGGVYAPTGPPRVRKWRLFQIVFIVVQLAALAAREPSGAHLRDELSHADVLWFPTGGGKSAALYGITAVAMFYDRLRGKTFGTTSIIRFPLRMLSVQQLDRIQRLVVCCELVRSAHHGQPKNAGEAGEAWDLGEPFELGYFVGRNNTPNRLTDAADTKWRDIANMARQDASWCQDRVVLPTCPYCGGERVTLRPDVASVRLRHTCPDCSRDLPVSITDDEVYRYLPSILVATVDKLATVAFNPHFSHLTHGPANHCPDHGFITFRQGTRSEPHCLARQYCARNPREWTAVIAYDPAPSLVIQDELHLLAEELGTFAAHYETLWQHLCRTGSKLPSKTLAATATISDYANQVRQLYALQPRRFPSEGWLDGQSFYARRHDDLTRRLFVGALPSLMDTTSFSLACGDAIRHELERLRALDPHEVIADLDLTSVTGDQVDEWLFAYELQLYYVNRKTDADRVLTHTSRVGQSGSPAPFEAQRLTGANRLAEISDVIRRVERETLDIPAGRRLAAIAGTSLVSHGVDLARLNVQFILGMPSTLAYYVQATSRAGRSQVGLIVTALGRHHLRDRSVFHFFEPTHRHVNALVEPVALNRFSLHGPRKTASGLLAALLLNEIGRSQDALAPYGSAPIDFGKAEIAAAWLAARGGDAERQLRSSIHDAFGLSSNVLDPVIAENFRNRVDHELDALLPSLSGTEPQLTRRLRPRPPTSFRDIDAPADFSANGAIAARMFAMLGGVDDGNDDLPEMADEAGNT
ncbi:hypothetical protein [Rugosimonospora africana]|uniref:hypothetical protein n=1 Tax=Rugosimonospora africana TaxID=556532 RepID=UPI001940780B|nr:hypothetical protein [Rugosimonospora africana]